MNAPHLRSSFLVLIGLLALILVACGGDAGTSTCPGPDCPCTGQTCVCEPGSSCTWDGSCPDGQSCSLTCSADSACEGACSGSCSASCQPGASCDLETQESGSIDCTGASCTLALGPSGSVSCTAGATCAVTCTGSCSLSCSSDSTCTLQCAGETSARPIAGSGSCS